MRLDTTDVAAAYGLAGRPFVVVLVVLFAIVLARSHLTYWAGRALARGAQYGQDKLGGPSWWRSTVAHVGRFAESVPARRGLSMVRRWGPVAVVLAYLTVGVQTAVFAGSGLLRMPYGRFTLASLPGAVGWALIWATVGLGAVWAALALSARSPWTLAGVLVVLAVVAAALVAARARARRRPAPALATNTDTPAA